MVGKKFGRYTVIAHAPNNNRNEKMCLCQCDCGYMRVIRQVSLTTTRVGKCNNCHINDAKTGAYYNYKLRGEYGNNEGEIDE